MSREITLSNRSRSIVVKECSKIYRIESYIGVIVTWHKITPTTVEAKQFSVSTIDFGMALPLECRLATIEPPTAYMLSGAETPSSVNPLRRTRCTPRASATRALRSASSSTSTRWAL